MPPAAPATTLVSMPSDRYDVHIAFEVDGEPREAANLLLRVLGDERAHVAPPGAVSSEDDRVVIHFYELVDQVPPHGAEFRPPRVEEPTEAPGRTAIEHLHEMHGPPSPLVPVARALVAVSAARERAGLTPRQHITIEVEPSRVHCQDELRHDHS